MLPAWIIDDIEEEEDNLEQLELQLDYFIYCDNCGYMYEDCRCWEEH